MNCEQATQLVSLECEEKITLKEKASLQLHLWICPKCRYFKHNNEKLRQMMKGYAEQDLQKKE